MSVLRDINPHLSKFVWQYFGEERLHDLAEEFLQSEKAIAPHADAIEHVTHQDPLFLSWMWHDYRVRSETGQTKTILELFAEATTDITQGEARALQQLIDSQVFSLFRAGEIRPGNIELEDLRTGIRYHVREYQMASQIKTGACVHLRLCRQDDHWEIIVPDGIVPLYIDQDVLNDIAGDLPEDMTIRDSFAFQNLLQQLGLLKDSPPTHVLLGIDYKDARQVLFDALQSTGIDRYISLERIEQLMRAELGAAEDPLAPPISIRLLLGLLTTDSKSDHELIMQAAAAFWNTVADSVRKPRKRRKQGHPGVKLDSYDPFGWLGAAAAAHDQFKSGSIKEATRQYDALFERLHEESSTSPSLYRLVANAASAHLSAGNLLLGEHLMGEALRLCPDYDFALQQQKLIADGMYTMPALPGQLSFYLPPTQAELRAQTDNQILVALQDLGIELDPVTLERFISKTKTEDDVLHRIWKLPESFEDIDTASVLLAAGRERWAPEVIWPSTLHEYTQAIEEALLPYEGDSDWREVAAAIDRLGHAVSHASKQTLKSWMNDTREYAEYRQDFIFYIESAHRCRKTTIQKKLEDLYQQLLTLTKDPVFMVPRVLAAARAGEDIRDRLQALHLVLPYDHLGLQLVGDNLPAKQHLQAAQAYEHGIAALDARVAKKRWQYPPYDYEVLGDHYHYLIGQLEIVYKKLGNELARSALLQRLEAIDANEHLWHNARTEAQDADIDQLLHEKYGDHPIVRYLVWFDSLGIDLTLGDGQQSTLSIYNTVTGQKVGRNDPCPCGATKPDGTPIKYKKCCGVSF